MENEKDKGIAMSSENNGTVSRDSAERRTWHKPAVTRIEMKKTLNGESSGSDGTLSTAPPL